MEILREKNSLTAALAANFERLRTTAEREKSKICRAAASVHNGWKKVTKTMKKCGTESKRTGKIQKSVSKSKSTYGWQGRYCRKRASEGPHANLEGSGVISAKESTVASGITVSGAGIGES